MKLTTVIGARGRKEWRYGRVSRVLSIPLLAALAAPTTAQAQTCGLPAGGTITGVINTYYPGVNAPNAGDTTITVDITAIRGAILTPIATGDMLIVMQMQDADINSTNGTAYGANNGTGRGATAVNNSGVYEYVVATSAVNGVTGALGIVGAGAGNGLLNAYRTAAATATAGQRTFQVIRVPRFSSATLGAALTAAAWNGRTGGVLALDVAGTLTLAARTVNLDGLGFRGAGGRALGGDATLVGTEYVSLSTL